MQAIFEAYLDRLDMLQDELRCKITGLSNEALDWSPGPEMNSLAVLAAHTIGSTRYWIGDVIARDDSHRDRAAEFRTRGVDAEALLNRWEAVLQHSRGVVQQLALPDLEATRIANRDGREVTVAWALTHALEHLAIHVGHMQIMRDLWERRPPPG